MSEQNPMKRDAYGRSIYREDADGGYYTHEGSFMDTCCIRYRRDGIVGVGLAEYISRTFEQACEQAAAQAHLDWQGKQTP
jgi:uncharacterized protein YkwD